MKLTARKRIELLLDEIEYLNQEEGHLQAAGKINNREVYVLARDSFMPINNLIKDFSAALNIFNKIENNPRILILIFDLMSDRKDPSKSVFPPDPTYFLLDKKGVGKWYNLLATYSKKIPIISMVFDKLGAAGTFPIMFSDIVAMTENAGMSIGRKDVVEKILGANISYEELGGAKMHERCSGSVDFVGKNEEEVLKWIKGCINFIKKYNSYEENLSDYKYSFNGDIEQLIPKNPSVILDMDKLIKSISDDNSFIELKKNYASEIIIGFATFQGKPSAIIANRSAVNSGLFFPKSCYKAADFVKICDKFNIPILFLVDSCGFMVGKDVEQQGIIKAGANLFSSIANSKVPKISIVVRRAYTAGVYAMGGGHIADSRFVALPSAIISIYSETIGSMLTKSEKDKKSFEAMMKSGKSPMELFEKGYLDSVIEYNDLRKEIVNFISKLN